jgi:hypothetical protein
MLLSNSFFLPPVLRFKHSTSHPFTSGTWKIWNLQTQTQASKTSLDRQNFCPSENHPQNTRIHLQSSHEASNIVDAERSRARQHHRTTSYMLNEHQPPSCEGMEMKNNSPPPVVRQPAIERTSCHHHRRCRHISPLTAPHHTC